MVVPLSRKVDSLSILESRWRPGIQVGRLALVPEIVNVSLRPTVDPMAQMKSLHPTEGVSDGTYIFAHCS